MVKAPRKKLVIAVLVLAAAVTAFAVQPVRDAICFVALSPAEKKVVGEWHSSSIGGVGVTTIHADHTWTFVGGCFDPPPTIRGRWRVEGSDIVFTPDPRQFPPSYVPESRCQSIHDLIAVDEEVRSHEDRK